MIAPSNIQFFNKNGQSIGNKEMLAQCMRNCHGLLGFHSMYWRMGFQETDPALLRSSHGLSTRNDSSGRQSLLLDGSARGEYADAVWRREKVFHRLQLEIIRASNDQSIFAWGLGDLELAVFSQMSRTSLRIVLECRSTVTKNSSNLSKTASQK